jgi:hypothetical protein
MCSSSLNHSSDDEHSGPITYEIFIKQQEQEQSQRACSSYSYSNEISPSFDTTDHSHNSENIIIDESITDELDDKPTSLPDIIYPLPSSILSHESDTLTNASPKSEAKQTTSSKKPRSKKHIFYICSFPECHKLYEKVSRLHKHEMTHSKIKPFPCTWPGCEWKFMQASELKGHYR